MLETSKTNMEDIFQQTIEDISEKLNNMSVEELKKYSKNAKYNNDDKTFPLKIVDTGINYDEDKRLLKVETIIGKSYYLSIMLHLLKETIKILHKHEWKVIDLDKKVKIPTSDDPVICLSYYANNTYDFGGGWNNKGSEIIFPISLNKIVYTKVGAKDIKFKLDYQLSILIKNIIVEHAYRKIFSVDKEKWITKTRKRYVNANEFKREKEMLENWHKNYKNIESEYLEHKVKKRSG